MSFHSVRFNCHPSWRWDRQRFPSRQERLMDAWGTGGSDLCVWVFWQIRRVVQKLEHPCSYPSSASTQI